MHLTAFPFTLIDWTKVPASEHKGERGTAVWRTVNAGGDVEGAGSAMRMRIVEYTPGYTADHWCGKGHIVYCLAGELRTELRDGRAFTLTPGMSYHVADTERGGEEHRSSTETGARLFIVD